MYVKIYRNAGNGEDPRFSSLCPSEKYLETPLNSCIMGGTRDSGVGIRPTPHTRSTSGVMEMEIIYATCALTQIISLLLPCLGISVSQNLNWKLNASWSNLEQLMRIARCDVDCLGNFLEDATVQYAILSANWRTVCCENANSNHISPGLHSDGIYITRWPLILAKYGMCFALE